MSNINWSTINISIAKIFPWKNHTEAKTFKTSMNTRDQVVKKRVARIVFLGLSNCYVRPLLSPRCRAFPSLLQRRQVSFPHKAPRRIVAEIVQAGARLCEKKFNWFFDGKCPALSLTWRLHLPLRLRLSLGTGLLGPALVASLDGSGAGGPVGTVSVPGAGSGSTSSVRGSGESTGGAAGDLPLVVEARLNGTGANLLNARDLGLVLTSGVLVLLGLRVAVEVKIGHDVPLGLTAGDGATKTEDLTSEHPPDQTNGVTALVVGGDGNVDVLGGRVGVAEGDDRDVDIGGLLDGLGVGARVGDNDQARLLEGAGDVVGEVTGGETTGNGTSTSVGGELQDGTLTVGTGRDDADVGGVVNGGDDTGGQDNLLPLEESALNSLDISLGISGK